MKDTVGDILEDVFDRAWKEIMIYEDYITDIRKKAKMMNLKSGVQDARIDQYSTKIAMKQINLDILTNVIGRMIKDIAGESHGVNEFAKLTSMNLLTKGLKV